MRHKNCRSATAGHAAGQYEITWANLIALACSNKSQLWRAPTRARARLTCLGLRLGPTARTRPRMEQPRHGMTLLTQQATIGTTTRVRNFAKQLQNLEKRKRTSEIKVLRSLSEYFSSKTHAMKKIRRYEFLRVAVTRLTTKG